MSCSFLILRVHVSQSQYDKNLSLFMWDMCMLSWLVRWIGWPFESDICNQSPVKVLDFFREDPFLYMTKSTPFHVGYVIAILVGCVDWICLQSSVKHTKMYMEF